MADLDQFVVEVTVLPLNDDRGKAPAEVPPESLVLGPVVVLQAPHQAVGIIDCPPAANDCVIRDLVRHLTIFFLVVRDTLYPGRDGNECAHLSLECFEFASLAPSGQAIAAALICLMGDFLLCMETLRGMKLYLEPLTLRGDPASVDPPVLRVVTPVIFAVNHREPVGLEPLLEVPVAICVLARLKTEDIPDRVIDLPHCFGRRPVGLVLDFLGDLLLETVLALRRCSNPASQAPPAFTCSACPMRFVNASSLCCTSAITSLACACRSGRRYRPLSPRHDPAGSRERSTAAATRSAGHLRTWSAHARRNRGTSVQ